MQFVIPAEITRKVHDGLVDSFEAKLAEVVAGGTVGARGVVDLARLLKRLPDMFAHRDALVRMLQDEQDPETGLIIDRPEWECWPKGLAELTSALRVLGGTLRHKVPKLEALRDTDALIDWVRSRNWDHPWGGATGSAHMIGGVLFATSDLGILKLSALARVFDCLDELRDDTWGVWAKGHFDESNPGFVQLGGAFYFGVMYDRFKRPLSRPEGACRMLMEMQEKAEIGTFCISPDRSWPFASSDHDSLYVLTRYARLNEDVRELVMPAVERYARYFVRQMTNPEKFVIKYPIPKILSILRPIFPDPADDIPYWDYEMYKWVL